MKSSKGEENMLYAVNKAFLSSALDASSPVSVSNSLNPRLVSDDITFSTDESKKDTLSK